MKKRILAIFAYVLPSFPLGFFWHLTIFADYYKSLEVYRDEVVVPMGLLSILIQGTIFSVLYERLFAGESVLRGAAKFALLAAPLVWSYMVLAAAAKHRMASVGDYLLIESAFVAVHFAVVSPLIATIYSRKSLASERVTV